MEHFFQSVQFIISYIFTTNQPNIRRSVWIGVSTLSVSSKAREGHEKTNLNTGKEYSPWLWADHRRMHSGYRKPVTPEIICTVILLFLSEYSYKRDADGLNVDLWRLKVVCAFSAVLKYLTRTTRTNLDRIFISFLRLNN